MLLSASLGTTMYNLLRYQAQHEWAHLKTLITVHCPHPHTPPPCASTAAVPKVQAKQQFNAHRVLSHNPTMVVTLRHHIGNISVHLSGNVAEPWPPRA